MLSDSSTNEVINSAISQTQAQAHGDIMQRILQIVSKQVNKIDAEEKERLITQMQHVLSKLIIGIDFNIAQYERSYLTSLQLSLEDFPNYRWYPFFFHGLVNVLADFLNEYPEQICTDAKNRIYGHMA